MKVVILAGGLGTRLSEETVVKPKPMVEIGQEPILWHIMKIYDHCGYRDFIICGGYKQELIKQYFNSYVLNHSTVKFSFSPLKTLIIHKPKENWNVMVADTGFSTMTGGRIKRISNFLPDNEDFLMTYGDGVADINVNELVAFHKRHGKLATVTGIQPVGRFGRLSIDTNDFVTAFSEKEKGDDGWINAGFYVLNKKVINYIKDDDTVFENEPMSELAKIKELKVYKHRGFWEPMDTLNDKRKLEELWKSNPPWKIWNE